MEKKNRELNTKHLQYESSITSGVGGRDFSVLVNAKYVKLYHVVCTVPQSKFETCDESLDSRGFFDEAGYEDDPGK
jgi:hypothetical protein